ncbi:MAG: GC-type dockerin domain-anchored protein [Phycisphaerales bacterium]
MNARTAWPIAGMAALVGIMVGAETARAQFIFQRSLGSPNGQEIAYDVHPLTQGVEVLGFASAGSIDQGAAPTDLYLTRTRTDGSTVWQRILGNPNVVDYATSIRDDNSTAANGGFIVSGETEILSATGAPSTQIFVMRLNGLGNVLWSNIYGGSAGIDFPAGTSTRLVTNLGSVTVGRRTGVTQDPIDGVMIGVNPAGNPIFQRLYFARPMAGVNFGILSLNDVRVTPVGYMAVGWTDYRQFGGELAPCLLETDPFGNVINFWVYPFPGREVYGDGIAITDNGFAISCRSIVPGNAQPDLIVMHVDPAGNPLWTRFLPAFRNGFAAINYSPDNRKIIVGGTVPVGPNLVSDAAMIRFDLAGVPEWSSVYGAVNADLGHAADTLPCGRGYVLAGSDRIPGNVGLTDQYLVRVHATGRSGCLEGPNAMPGAIGNPPRITFPIEQRDQQEFQAYPVINTFLGANITHCLNTTCPADIDDGSGTGTPDGGVTIDDALYFLSLYNSGNACGDLDDGSGTGTPDGGVTIDDLLFFIARYNAGC